MIKSFYYFIKLILLQKDLILSMAKREVAANHIGSLLGFVWTFVNPIVMIFIYWFVFSIGFKVKPVGGDVPFAVWLAVGMSIWLVFSDIVNGASKVVVSNSHLIKKLLFHSQILPVVTIVSCLLTHVVFILIVIVLILLYSMPFSMYYLQSLYYLFCMIVLALGLGWTVAALNVFIRDVSQIVGVIFQMGFWVTPIFWDINMMPPKVQLILKLNPMYYVVQGYRESFIHFVPFWMHPRQTIYFWCVAVIILVSGALIFKKLKPHFADVL
ncbi:MAG: ABC transporter permease [Desulfobacterales bacterium]